MEESVHERPELIQTADEQKHVLSETSIPDPPSETASTDPQPIEQEKQTTQEEKESAIDDSEEKHVIDQTAGETEEEVQHEVFTPIPISNAFLKFALENAPPTPRNSSPGQILVEGIHSSFVDGEIGSPVERKEEEVRLPTKICEFPVISTQDKAVEGVSHESDPKAVEEENTEAPGDKDSDSTNRNEEENVPDEPAQDSTTESLQDNDIQNLEESALLVSDAEPEFDIISPDEAPLEFAEEYPQFQFEDNYPMARQDESDDLEASTITAMESSRATISVQDNESEENEPRPESDIQVAETVVEPVPEESVAGVEEPDVDDTEAFETASVVTVQSIHSVIPIEHPTTEVEVEHDSHHTEASLTEESPAPIMDGIAVDETPAEESPEEVNTSPEPVSTEVNDPIPEESPEELSVSEVNPASVDDEPNNEPLGTMAEDETEDVIPATEGTSEEELTTDNYELALAEDSLLPQQDLVELEPSGNNEMPVEEEVTESEPVEVLESTIDASEEEIPTEGESPATEEPIAIEEPSTIEETPIVEETPEATITENEMTPAVSEIESTEGEIAIPPIETSQDDPLLLSKEIEKPLQHDFIVNTAEIENDSIDLFQNPQIIDDKDSLPLIEVNEIESPTVEESTDLITSDDPVPQEPVSSEDIAEVVLPLPKAEELVCDDAISELNIPAPVTALVMPTEESLIAVPETEEPISEDIVEEAAVDVAPDVEEEEDVSKDIEEPAVADTVLPEEEVHVEEAEPVLDEVSPIVEETEQVIDTAEEAPLEADIAGESPMEATPMVEFKDLLDDDEGPSQEVPILPTLEEEKHLPKPEEPVEDAPPEDVAEPLEVHSTKDEEPVLDETAEEYLEQPEESTITDEISHEILASDADVEDDISPAAIEVPESEDPIDPHVEEEFCREEVQLPIEEEVVPKAVVDETPVAESVAEEISDEPVHAQLAETTEIEPAEESHDEVPEIVTTEDVPMEDVSVDMTEEDIATAGPIVDVVPAEPELSIENAETQAEPLEVQHVEEPPEAAEEVAEVEEQVPAEDLTEEIPEDVVDYDDPAPVEIPEEVEAVHSDEAAEDSIVVDDAAVETAVDEPPTDDAPDDEPVGDTTIASEAPVEDETVEPITAEAPPAVEIEQQQQEEDFLIPVQEEEVGQGEIAVEVLDSSYGPQGPSSREIEEDDDVEDAAIAEIPEPVLAEDDVEEAPVGGPDLEIRPEDPIEEAALEDQTANIPETVAEEVGVGIPSEEATPQEPTDDLFETPEIEETAPESEIEETAIDEVSAEEILEPAFAEEEIGEELPVETLASEVIPEETPAESELVEDTPVEPEQTEEATAIPEEPVMEDPAVEISLTEDENIEAPVQEEEVTEEWADAQVPVGEVEEMDNTEYLSAEKGIPEERELEEVPEEVDIPDEVADDVEEDIAVDTFPVEEENLDDIPEYLPLPPEVDTSLNVFDDFDDTRKEPTEELPNHDLEEYMEPEDALEEEEVMHPFDTPQYREVDEEDDAAQVESEFQDDFMEPETFGSVTEPPIDDEEFEHSLIEVSQVGTEHFDASDGGEDLVPDDDGFFPEDSEEAGMAVDDMGFPLDLSQNVEFLPSEMEEGEPVSIPLDENRFDDNNPVDNENVLDDDYMESRDLEQETAVDDMRIPLDLSQNADVTGYHDDSAQESDISLLPVDTPQTPMSPMFVHKNVESYTELLHDADDETVERSIQDDFSTQEPLPTDLEAGEAFEDFAVGEQINEVTEEEDGVGHYEDPILDSIAVEDDAYEAESVLDDTPVAEIALLQQELTSELNPPVDRSEDLMEPETLPVEIPPIDLQIQDAAPAPKVIRAVNDESDIYELLQPEDTFPTPKEANNLPEAALNPSDIINPVDDEPWVQEVLAQNVEETSDPVPVPEVTEEAAEEETKVEDPLEREIISEIPGESEMVENLTLPVEESAPILSEEQEPELPTKAIDIDEHDEQIPVDIEVPSEREVVEESPITVEDEFPLAEDHDETEQAPVADIAREATVSDPIIESAEMLPEDTEQTVEYSAAEDNAFAEPTWMTESGIADMGTEVDSLAPTTAVEIPEEKTKDADEVSLNDLAPFYKSPEGASTENTASEEHDPEMLDEPHEDGESEIKTHSPAVNLSEEYAESPPEKAAGLHSPPRSPLLKSSDELLQAEERDQFSYDPTYQTPISSPMSSPFLTPRSTRAMKSAYADSTLTLPLLPVDTSKPTLITVIPSEISNTDSFPDSSNYLGPSNYVSNLDSLPIYIRGPQVPRPGTSYSWLGRMFDPIDPEIENAQKEGWVKPLEEVQPEEEGKKNRPRRLRRKFFNRELDTVGEEAELERKGSAEEKGGGKKMWDIMKKIVKG